MKQLMHYYYQMRHNYIYQILIQTPNQILKECFIKTRTHQPPAPKTRQKFPANNQSRATHIQQSQINKKWRKKAPALENPAQNALWNRNKENQHLQDILCHCIPIPFAPLLCIARPKKNEYCFRSVVEVIPL